MQVVFYTLNEKHIPIRCTDLVYWANWCFDIHNRLVKRDYLSNGVLVSTVFLGVAPDVEPSLLFETMVCGGPLDRTCERYRTWDQAVDGHDRILDKCRKGFLSN